MCSALDLPRLAIFLVLLIITDSAQAAFMQGSGGLVSVESESFHGDTPRNGFEWLGDTSQTGFSGTSAMRSLPDTRTRISVNYAADSPQLDYQVNFITTGIHFVWVRGLGPGAGNSVHVGLDGQELASSSNIDIPKNTGWAWSSGAHTINVTSTGAHTINVWMREDGTRLDKIVLATDPNFTPSGAGPVESSQGEGGNSPPNAVNDNINVPQDGTANLVDVLTNDSDPDGDALSIDPSITDVLSQQGGTVSVNGAQDGLLYTPPASYIGPDNFTYGIIDGNDGTDTAMVNVTVDSIAGGGGDSSGSGGFQQNTSGLVAMESESFHDNVSQGGIGWTVDTSQSGFSGTSAMRALPDSGERITSNFAANSPQLDYLVNFVSTGIHYVWIRGLGPGAGNSVHVGLDGQQIASADNINIPKNSGWAWSSGAHAINVFSTGEHTINVWMREDGTRLDKIVLTTDSSFVPSGAGPEESTLGDSQGDEGNSSPNAVNDNVNVSQDSSDNLIDVLSNDSDPDGDALSIDPSITDVLSLQGGTVSVNGGQDRILYTPPVGYSGPDRFAYGIDDGNTGDDTATVNVTVDPDGGGGGSGGSGGGGFQQNASGLVSMESESFNGNISQGGIDWTVDISQTGYSGASAMRALPDSGERITSNFAANSPRLDYLVNFVSTGIHYVWIRGLGPGAGNSVHVGLDGQQIASADNIDIPKNSGWTWSSGAHTINVPTAGEHTINVWMREDGTRLDKIVLTTDSDFVPSGSGPAENGTNLCQPVPSVAISSPQALHIQSSSNLTIRATVCLDSVLHADWGVRFVLDENSSQEQEATDHNAPFEVTISGVDKGEHVVKALLVNENDVPQAGVNNADEVQSVGIGDYAVAMGDSITAGTGDDDPSDDTCPDGRVTGGGYPPILCAELNNHDLTSDGDTFPHFIANEGVGGDRSADGVALIPAVLANHPEAQQVIIWYGMNDARPSNPTPSGLGRNPGDGGYPGSFKYNLQQMVDAVVDAGKEPVLAEIIVALGDCANPAQCATYADPDQGARSVNIQEFNAVILELRSELNSDGNPSNDIQVVPSPFYDMFNPNKPQGHIGEYADHIHPNGKGYRTTVTEQGGWLDALCPSCR